MKDGFQLEVSRPPFPAFVNVTENANEKPSSPRFRAPRGRAFALVATLLMIAVITGAAVAFFQSTRIERFVTRNYADLARARLAAEGAVAVGQALIAGLFTNYPDSCVGWALVPDVTAGRTNGLATFYFRTRDTNGFLPSGTNSAVPGDSPVYLFAQPLASGANATPIANFTNAGPVFTNTNTPDGQAYLTASNSYDLNADNWIGTPPGAANRPVLRAKWVEILQDPTQAKNTNLNAAGLPINPAVARYAFWAEDESFRVNLNWCTNTVRGNNTPGTNPSEIVLPAALAGGFATNLGTAVVNLKNALGTNIPTPATLALATNNLATNSFETNKFVVTTTSSSLNFSRGGTLRLNLNSVIVNTNDATVIRGQLDRITAAITNQSAAGITNAARRTAAMPLFGQRFYRGDPTVTNGTNSLNNTNRVSGTMGANQRSEVYIQKIAANLRDYIDSDSQPTLVNNDNGFTVRAPTNNPPVLNSTNVNGNGTLTSFSEVAAVGKEAVPSLTEYAVRVLLTSWTTNSTGADFTFLLFHYFEFWNPTTKDIPLTALGTNPTLRITNMYSFNVGGGNIDPPSPQNISVPLTSFQGLTNFPANSFTVLTTEPPANASTCPFPNNNAFFRASNNFTIYTGRTTLRSGTGPFRVRAFLGTTAFPVRAGTSVSDYQLYMTLFNSTGTLESFNALATASSTAGSSESHLTIHNDTGNNLNSVNFLTLASSLRGNDSISRSGEPRSLNEQMAIVRYTGSGDGNNQTRFFNATVPQTSLGRLGTFVNPANWVDYSPAIQPGATTTPYRHLDSPLDGIGRLGDIYDPARFLATGSTEMLLVRGGGRTLKIGQAERWNSTNNIAGLWDGEETNASRNLTAWRLADVFTANQPNLPFSTAAPGVDPIDWNTNGVIDTNNHPTYRVSEWERASRIDGLVNIHGALRDTNALAALVSGLVGELSPSGAAATAGASLDFANLLAAIRNHLSGGAVDANPSNDRLFWERGQLGELTTGSNLPTATQIPVFSSSGPGIPNLFVSNAMAVPLNTTQDRGREELARRLLDLITTKGNTYTVYAVGQALDPRTGRVTANQRIRQTFRINPFYNTNLPADRAFNPARTGTDTSDDRFRRPDRFSVSVLHTYRE